MVEAGERDPFLLEAGEGDPVAADRGAQHLDRHLALELEVGGAVDGAEVAAAEQRLDAVFAVEQGARLELLAGVGARDRPRSCASMRATVTAKSSGLVT